jgi:predicted permease
LSADHPAESLERGPWFELIGVLRSDANIKSATADLNVVAHSISKIYPGGYLREFSAVVESFTDYEIGDVRGLLLTLVAAVTMLLLIACSNVANLLLARSTARAGEIAIRSSIGASRARLFQQLLVECLILALVGCFLGCCSAYFGLKGVVAAIPADTIPAEVAIRLSPFTLCLALAITVVCTVLAGLSPLLHTVDGDLSLRLTGSGKGARGDMRGGRLRAGLVVGEVALSILLLAGSGLMIRTLIALKNVSLGLDPNNVLSGRLYHSKRYDSAEQKYAFYRNVLDRVQEIPGIQSVAVSISVPPYSTGLTDVAMPSENITESVNAMSELCSEDYFRVLAIPLLAGRLFSRADVDAARHLVVINQSLARSVFPKEDPIGRRLKFPSWEVNYADWPRAAFFEIIGVVADSKNKGLRDPSMPQIYLPYTITATGLGDDRVIIAKARSNADSILPLVEHTIHDLDPAVAITDTGTIEAFMQEDAYAQPRLGLITMSAFAVVGVVLVAIGIFSVMAYTVSLQTHEIGIRMALGAQQFQISRMILNKGLRLIISGIIIGIGASFALTRLLASQIWGVSPADPVTFASALLLIVAVGLAACLLPARRASQVDPLVALRYE